MTDCFTPAGIPGRQFRSDQEKVPTYITANIEPYRVANSPHMSYSAHNTVFCGGMRQNMSSAKAGMPKTASTALSISGIAIALSAAAGWAGTATPPTHSSAIGCRAVSVKTDYVGTASKQSTVESAASFPDLITAGRCF